MMYLVIFSACCVEAWELCWSGWLCRYNGGTARWLLSLLAYMWDLVSTLWSSLTAQICGLLSSVTLSVPHCHPAALPASWSEKTRGQISDQNVLVSGCARLRRCCTSEMLQYALKPSEQEVRVNLWAVLLLFQSIFVHPWFQRENSLILLVYLGLYMQSLRRKDCQPLSQNLVISKSACRSCIQMCTSLAVVRTDVLGQVWGLFHFCVWWWFLSDLESTNSKPV